MNGLKAAIGGVVGFILLIIACNLWGSVDYAEYKIRQAPGSGKMSIISEPGMYWDGFADVSTYRVSGDIDFEEVTTMSDGAKVTFSGSVKFRLPSDEKTRLKLHKDFGSYDNVVENLIAWLKFALMKTANPKLLAKIFLMNTALKFSRL